MADSLPFSWDDFGVTIEDFYEDPEFLNSLAIYWKSDPEFARLVAKFRWQDNVGRPPRSTLPPQPASQPAPQPVHQSVRYGCVSHQPFYPEPAPVDSEFPDQVNAVTTLAQDFWVGSRLAIFTGNRARGRHRYGSRRRQRSSLSNILKPQLPEPARPSIPEPVLTCASEPERVLPVVREPEPVWPSIPEPVQPVVREPEPVLPSSPEPSLPEPSASSPSGAANCIYLT